MTTDEIKKGNFIGPSNAIPSLIDKRDYVASFIPTAQITLPDKYTTENLTEVLDQGSVGSCVAHAVDSTFEYLNQLHNGKYQRFSPGFNYAHKSDRTSIGMAPRDALKFICNNGNIFQTDFPYNLEVPDIFTQYEKSGGDTKFLPLANKHKEISTYFSLKTKDDIKSAIYKYGYCVACIPIREDTRLEYEFIDQDPVTLECKDYNAYFTEGTGTIKSYHMICLVGWDEEKESYILQNSWSKTWGKNGFAFLPYSFTVIEAWGCSGYTEVYHKENPAPVPDPVINKPSSDEFIQFILKIVNWFLNLFGGKK